MTVATALRDFDPAEYLDGPEAYAAYLQNALETGDTDFVLRSIGVVARAKGMAQIAKDTGLARASLYRGLNAGGNPDFATVLKVLGSIGVELGVTAAGGPQSVAV